MVALQSSTLRIDSFFLPLLALDLEPVVVGVNVVAAVVAILTVAYVMMNFLVDVLYSILDPRIRHAAR